MLFDLKFIFLKINNITLDKIILEVYHCNGVLIN